MDITRVFKWDPRTMGDFSEDQFRFHFVKQRYSPSTLRVSEPGAAYTPHHHPYDEYIAVTKGCLDVAIYGERYRLSPGTALFVKANEVHSAFVVGERDVESFDAIRYASWTERH